MFRTTVLRCHLLLFVMMITGCTPKSGVLPSIDEVVERRGKITMHQAQVYCNQKGGRFEQWDTQGTGHLETLCILPNGYGCQPIEFVRGICGGVDDF